MIAFAPNQPTYAPVRMDDGGMVIEDLERVLAATPRARLLYTVPEFQNPTGVTLSVERRQAVIDLADRYDLVVIEDTPYRHLRYDGVAVPTLKSLDTQGRVIHLGSFSKILAPGMRLGWAVAAPDLLARLGLLKLAADTQCSTLNMAAAAAFMARYDIHAHIDHMRGAYKRKRDLMLDSLAEHMPPGGHLDAPHRRPVHVAHLPRRLRCHRLHARPGAADRQGRVCARRHVLPGPPGAEPRPGELLGGHRRGHPRGRAATGCAAARDAARLLRSGERAQGRCRGERGRRSAQSAPASLARRSSARRRRRAAWRRSSRLPSRRPSGHPQPAPP